MVECQTEARHGRPIGLGFDKTVGQRGRHALVSRRARTVARVNQTRITQGRVKKEGKSMREEAACIGVDVAKSTLDVAVTDSEETRQFANENRRSQEICSREVKG